MTFYTAPTKALVSGEVLRALRQLRRQERRNPGTRGLPMPRSCAARPKCWRTSPSAKAPNKRAGQVRDGRVHFLRRRPRAGRAAGAAALPAARSSSAMSATLGDVANIATDLTRRTGRETAVIDDADRPVPLTYAWSVEPLHELLEELARADQAPIYVVHFTQASAMERAQSLLSAKLCTRDERERRSPTIGSFPHRRGFGRMLSTPSVAASASITRMLPRYPARLRRTRSCSRLMCGTDTLGVGINVPIRALAKSTAPATGCSRAPSSAGEVATGRARRLRHLGYVVPDMQAPERVIERTRALAKGETQELQAKETARRWSAGPKRRSRACARRGSRGARVTHAHRPRNRS